MGDEFPRPSLLFLVLNSYPVNTGLGNGTYALLSVTKLEIKCGCVPIFSHPHHLEPQIHPEIPHLAFGPYFVPFITAWQFAVRSID